MIKRIKLIGSVLAVLSFSCLVLSAQPTDTSRLYNARIIAKQNNLKGSEYSNYISSIDNPKTILNNYREDSPQGNKTTASCGAGTGNNIGFELGNLTDWSFFFGKNLRSLPDSLGFSWSAGTKSLVTTGTDPVCGVNLSSPLGGTTVIKLNDNSMTGDYTGMKTRFRVSPSNTLLKTAYLPVLQLAGHLCENQPFFKIQILNCDETVVLREFFTLAPESVCKGINTMGHNGGFYSAWQVLCFDLSAYVNQSVTLKVIASDCTFAGHYGYAYFDAILTGSSPNSISGNLLINTSAFPYAPPVNSGCFSNPATFAAPAGATSYSWSTPTSSVYASTFTTTTPGYYSMAMTNSSGCMFANQFNIGIDPALVLTASSTTVCALKTFTLTGSGGTSYIWKYGSSYTNSNPISQAISSSQTYTLIGFNGKCSDTTTQAMTVFPGASLTTSGNSSVCTGSSATLTANGAATYTWNTGANTNSIVVSPTVNTNYTVTGTTALGCNGPASVINVQAVPTSTNLNVIVYKPTLCSGDSSYILATGAQSYSWDFGATTNTVYVKPASTTIYTLTANMLCGVIIRTVQVTVNTPTFALSVTAPSTVCSNTSFTVSASGASSYTYHIGASTYYSSPITAATSAIINFTVTGKDANSCRISTVVPISVAASPTVSVFTPSVVCPGQTVTYTATPSLSSYTWMNSSSFPVGNNPTISITYTTVNNHYLQGTDSLGCISNKLYFGPWVENANPTSATTTLCIGQSISWTGPNHPAGTTYTWSTGANTKSLTVSPTVTTVYTVQATTPNCGIITSTFTASVTANYAPTVSISAPTNTTCAGTGIGLTASGANTYQWFNSFTLPYLYVPTNSPGTYNYYVVGTAANGCKATAFYSVTCLPSPTININGPVSVCPGGTHTFVLNGASSYTWNGGSNSSTLAVSPTANTNYTITGSNGSCTTSTTTSISIKAKPTITLTTWQYSVCPGQLNMLNVYNSTAYNYTWSTGSNYDTTYVTPTVPTVYACSVTANGCVGYDTITIGMMPVPSLSLSTYTVCAYSGIPIGITVNPTGGTFSNGITSNSVMPVTPGTYSISYLQGGCTAKTTFTVLPPACVSLVSSLDSMCTGQTALLSYSPSGGFLSGSFLSGNNFIPTASGTHTVGYNYTDAYGCTYSDCLPIKVDLCTDIREDELPSVSAHPNPFKNEFVVNNPGGIKLNITVYDVNGRIILEQRTSDNSVVNLEGQSQGIYYVKMESETACKFSKLIKL